MLHVCVCVTLADPREAKCTKSRYPYAILHPNLLCMTSKSLVCPPVLASVSLPGNVPACQMLFSTFHSNLAIYIQLRLYSLCMS